MQVGGDPPVELSNASPKFDGTEPWEEPGACHAILSLLLLYRACQAGSFEYSASPGEW
jgi:hypothetical protein